MDEEIKRYGIVSKAASSIVISQTLIMILICGIILFINKSMNLNKIWNICFLIPTFVMYTSCVILDSLVNFRVGRYRNEEDIKKRSLRMSNLIFVSNIIFFTLIFSTFMYVLMSIILFS